MQYNKYIIKTSAYPWNGEGFLMVERLSKQRLSVCLIDIHHCLTKRNKNKRWKANTTTANSWLQARCGSFHAQHTAAVRWGLDEETRVGELTMFQNLSKATTKPEHTPLSPLKVLMWTLTLILSSTHRYSSPNGLPLHTEDTRQNRLHS